MLIYRTSLNTEAASATGRNGAIDIRVCEYTNHDYILSTKESPSRTYTRIGYAFAYNNEETTSPLAGHSVNSWNELERVNNNVLALYTHVPGQGFSKYYITAVEENNPVTLLPIERLCYDENISETAPEYVKKGGVKAKISWRAQKYDRETLNTYEVWYRTYRRNTDGTLVSECNDTWMKAGEADITFDPNNYYPDYSNGNPQTGTLDATKTPTGSFYHELTYGGADTEDTSDDYDLTYEYMVIPIYDASNHRGTESIYSQTVPSAAPRYPATASLSQVTDGTGDNLKYSFNLKLDVVANDNLKIPYAEDGSNNPSIPGYWVVIDADDAEERAKIGNALNQATSVVCVDENGNELSGLTIEVGNLNEGVTMTANNCWHYWVPGYSVYVSGFNRVYSSAYKFPSLVWKNVDPSIAYKVKVYCNAYREYNFIGSPRAEGTMVIPAASTTMTTAEFQPLNLNDDYSGMSREEILPMGAKLRRGSDEVTNPVTLSAANTLGTKGSAVNPLAVTDEVLANWNVQYTYHVSQNGTDILTTAFDASDVNSALYSNSTNVVVDVLGLPVAKTDWDIHTAMELSDDQKAANGNITKQNYDASTTQAYVFKTKVDVSYTRKTNAVTVSNTNGTESTIAMPSASPFNQLTITNNTSLGALFQRTSTHWDENCDVNDGYYKYYYDAGIQWIWSEYSDNLNKYIGYHAVTQTECAGHYETSASTKWTQFYAANILSDTFVGEYNKTLKNSGLTEFMSGIGYDGTNNTDWSALATSKRALPMNIHYVWGGNAWVTTDAERQAIKMSVILTADYPMIEGVTLKVNEYVDGQNYSMISNAVSTADAESQSATVMNMITVPTPLNNLSVDYTTTVTGVEGILTDACGGVQLYPNPVESTFTLRAPMALGEVRIFTMDGQLVKVVKGISDTTATINVDELPQGMYIVNTLGVAQIMIKN